MLKSFDQQVKHIGNYIKKKKKTMNLEFQKHDLYNGIDGEIHLSQKFNI